MVLFILCNLLVYSLFHSAGFVSRTVKYVSHTVKYVSHTVVFIFHTVKQRICQELKKNFLVSFLFSWLGI